jgi:hypothetical protein
VPSVFVVTEDCGRGLKFGDVNVIVLPPIPTLLLELSDSFPVTISFVPQGILAIGFNTSVDVCLGLLLLLLTVL